MEFVDASLVEQIETKMIHPSQFAIRDKFQKTFADDDDALVNSIREHGLLQPILIRPTAHRFEIVAGHRRFQACRTLRWRSVPCRIREISDKQAYELQLTENIQRKSMDPIEEAEAFRRYVVDFGWGGVTELARKLGMSEEYISHRIQLLKLPEDVKQKILLQRLKVSQAMELSNIPAETQSEIISQVIKKNLTVRQIREVKSILKQESRCNCESESSKGISKSVHLVRVTKKTSLALKITLARLDNLIDEIHCTIQPEDRVEIINFLMATRLKIHNMIDETIRFKNMTLKSMKH
jgi:ParB family transcriptional regulator, chromosome partitioning protein